MAANPLRRTVQL